MMLSVRLLMHIYQGVLLRWRLNADVLVIGASGSCCVGRAFTSITSGYTVFTTSAAWVLSADDVVKAWQQNVFYCSFLLLLT